MINADVKLDEDILMIRVIALYHNRESCLQVCSVSHPTYASLEIGISLLLSVLLALEIAAQLAAIIIKLARTDCKTLVTVFPNAISHKRSKSLSIRCLSHIQ